MRIKKIQSNVLEIDMTPMIDIVFQLIAFFMVITNFEQTQADERVKLPRDPMARPPEVKRDHELYLNVGFDRDDDGELIDKDPFVFYNGEPLRVSAMKPKLEQEARINKDIGINPEEMTVVIRADAEVPTGLVQELIKMSQEAGFFKFALKATQQRE